jgi:aspartyl-tRNA(Asn)/glutamyl-tRNA(Gln) amidotransferase subunit C
MRIGEAEVLHLAALAQLEITADELPGLLRDLEMILGHFAALASVDTRGVPPTSHVSELATPLRKDEIGPVLSVADVVRAAPRSAGGAVVVPRVVE